MAIRYVIGDATSPLASGPRILVHVCNDAGKWGKGFVLAISRRWKSPAQHGEVQFVEVERACWVANLVGQRGIVSRGVTAPAIRYDAVRAGLTTVRGRAVTEGASVHMPRIGCGLSGGTWDEIEPIVASELRDVSVTVYDFVE